MEYKFLGRNGLTKVFTTVDGWISTAKTSVLADAKSYTDTEIAKIPKYELPAATATAIGGVKPGSGLEVDSDGTMKVVLTGIEVDPGNIAKASKTGYGVVKAGDGVDITDGVISVSHPDVYTKTEADGKFQTAAQVETIAKVEVAKIVDGAPESLDTLKEIADTLNKDTEGGVVNSILTEIGKKANSADVYAKGDVDTAISTAKNELNIEIAKKATPADVETAKSEAISAAATAAESLYQKKADMPTFVEFTDEEIAAIAAAAVAAL